MGDHPLGELDVGIVQRGRPSCAARCGGAGRRGGDRRRFIDTLSARELNAVKAMLDGTRKAAKRP
jgi:hypothetical protein